MRPERPLLPPLPPLPPPAQSSQDADMDLPAGRLPDPVLSPILKHSLSIQSRSLRSAADGTSSVHFAADFRSRSRPESTSPSFDSFRTARSRPPSVSRSSTRRSASQRLGSQRDLRDEDARFVYINDAPRTNAPPAVFPDNSVHTAKYSILAFIPRNLYEQFRRVANVYFLILAMLNFKISERTDIFQGYVLGDVSFL